jgi:thiamine biosynthesis protein ThiI
MNEQLVVSVNFGEIALKGGNRSDFEVALVENIMATVGQSISKILRSEGRILIYPTDTEKVLQGLALVSGIAWYAPAFVLERDIDQIKSFVLANSDKLKGSSIKVDTSRSDKSFPMISPDINREIGLALEERGHIIDLKHPEKKIYVQILTKSAFVFFEKYTGLGGLPVGTSGKVLSLLSGGIDSPVSSWLMMRRGCSVDFLHVHAAANDEEVKKSKIPKVIELLKKYHPKKCRLFIATYSEFYKKSISMNPKSELVVFRRTYDKQEVINLAKKIGTYSLSIEEYKDCCSLVSMKHPSTKVKLDVAKMIEDQIGIEKIVEKTLEKIEVLEI